MLIHELKDILIEQTQFNKALAFESIPDEMKRLFDQKTKTFNGITHDHLFKYAQTISNKLKEQ